MCMQYIYECMHDEWHRQEFEFRSAPKCPIGASGAFELSCQDIGFMWTACESCTQYYYMIAATDASAWASRKRRYLKWSFSSLRWKRTQLSSHLFYYKENCWLATVVFVLIDEVQLCHECCCSSFFCTAFTSCASKLPDRAPTACLWASLEASSAPVRGALPIPSGICSALHHRLEQRATPGKLDQLLCDHMTHAKMFSPLHWSDKQPS